MKKLFIFSSIVTLFALKATAQTIISAKDAAKHIGENVTIYDKVYSTKLFDNTNMILLDLGGMHPNQDLTLVIKGDDRSKFTGKPDVDFKGKDVCVTGTLINFKDKPEIVLSDPAQLKLAAKPAGN